MLDQLGKVLQQNAQPDGQGESSGYSLPGPQEPHGVQQGEGQSTAPGEQCLGPSSWKASLPGGPSRHQVEYESATCTYC